MCYILFNANAEFRCLIQFFKTIVLFFILLFLINLLSVCIIFFTEMEICLYELENINMDLSCSVMIGVSFVYYSA